MSRTSRSFLRAFAGTALVAGAALAFSAQPSKAEDFKYPKFFNIVSPIVGSANHSLSVAWSSEFSAKTGVRVRVLPTSTGYDRSSWLNTGQGLISLVQPSDFFDQMDGTEGYVVKDAGPRDNRLAFVGLVTPWGFMVRGNGNIKTVDDIKKGTRVVFYSGSTFISNGIRGLVAMAGLTMDDVEKVEVGGYAANTKVLTEGRADVTFTSPLSGTSYEAEASPNGIAWLNIDPKHPGFAKYRALSAGYVLTKTVAGTKSAIGVTMDHAYQSNHVLEETSPDLVYHIVKWLMENHDLYKDKFTHAKMLNMDNLVGYLEAGALVPYHEGTIRYLKEKGKWNDKFQARQDQLVALTKKRVAVFNEAVAAAEKAGIDVKTPNDKWKAFWADYRGKHGEGKPFSEEVDALPM